MSRATPYQAAIACKGCGAQLGTFRVPKCHARASRAGVADLLIAQERDAAVCERCLGLPRAAHKAARRAAIAAEHEAAIERHGLTQDERALLVACPLVRCGAAVGQECRWIAGALTLGSGATHAERLDAERKARAHTLGAKYNAEHDHARRRAYLVEVLELAAERRAPDVRQLELFEVNP